jgi:hypothetical protein
MSVVSTGRFGQGSKNSHKKADRAQAIDANRCRRKELDSKPSMAEPAEPGAWTAAANGKMAIATAAAHGASVGMGDPRRPIALLRRG